MKRFALVAAAVAACSRYGAGETSELDAGADGTSDASPEAAVPVDGGTDTSTDGGCPGVFCDDFESLPIGASWNSVTAQDGTIAGTNAAKVGAQAMHVTMGTSTNDLGRNAFLTKTLPAPTRVACTFWVRIEAAPFAGYTDIAAFHSRSLAAGIKIYSLILAIDPGGIGLREDVTGTDGGCACPRKTVAVTPIVDATWTKIRFSFDFKKATISKNDQVVYEDTFGNFTPDQLSFDLGLRAYTKSAVDASYDELVCEVTP